MKTFARKSRKKTRTFTTATSFGAAPMGRVVIRQILEGNRLQPKLKVGAPNDAHEQEADRVADQIMRMPDKGTPQIGQGPEGVQRVCAECEDELQRQPVPEDENELQRQPAEEDEDELQRQPEEEEEESLQARAVAGETPAVTDNTASEIRSLRGQGRPMDHTTRAFFEPRFGRDFSNVRIHTGPQAAETAGAVKARAFTLGRDIVFGANQYSPQTQRGKHLLAHELTHVVQQSRASVAASSGNIQRKVTVVDPKKKIKKPGGKGLDQTNGKTVLDYLTKLCGEGKVKVTGAGQVTVDKKFCSPTFAPFPFGPGIMLPPPAVFSKTPTGCTCLCDMAASKHSWRIKVDDVSWPHTDFDDDDKANGRKPGGTGGQVTAPSPNTEKFWGAATKSGKTLNIAPWLVLGHELCGHGWLGNFGKHGPDHAKPRGKGGHQLTVGRENQLRKEHGIELRGTYKQPYCGESFWRSKKKPKKINWSSFLKACKQFRKAYNKKHGTKYKLKDTIP
ncbi:MAG: DUF4157 domain-containing protein [Acidobacteriota bacterium]|nr:DUF4157 domain-containing protein [Acidobacteriota bacterium]